MLLAGLIILIVLLAIVGTAGPRRALIMRPLLAWFSRQLPPMSAAERAAIESGTVGFEADLFSGKPAYAGVADLLTAGLSRAERDFLEQQLRALCAMLDEWQIGRDKDLPPEVWEFLKKERFFGLIIPEEYGGLGFSHAGHAAVVTTLATRSPTAAVTVMVPNSLGPAELLLNYGTAEQKNHYLPLLARGEEIPCFALTSPQAGSDAAAIPDTGEVVIELREGKETLGFRITWSKRYITLGPVATLLGLAFKVADPNRLLGDDPAPGITCALIPTNHAGVHIGRRHAPMNAAFMNGPNWGNDVFVPIEWVIGGASQIGHGWSMLMESLAAGRSISLPSVGIASQMLALRTVGAYAALREQFGLPIGHFDGVAEPLGRMAARLYAQDGARRIAYHEQDRGERPAVSSALLKYHLTEGARQAVIDAMDILGGKGICRGPRNFMAHAYESLPISITVEGANILTRSLIIFGQGSVRCHPYVQREMAAAAAHDIAAFDAAVCAHAGHILGNTLRSIGLLPLAELPAHDERLTALWVDLHRLSARFALAADCAMLVLGGKLKRLELQSARLGDVLAHMYLATGALLRWEGEGRRAEELGLAQLAAQSQLHEGYRALDAFFKNAPRGLRWLSVLAMPTGVAVAAPLDQQWLDAASLMMRPSAARAYLTWAVYIPQDRSTREPIAQLERALECSAQLRDVDTDLRRVGHGKLEERAAYLAGLSAEKVKLWSERELLLADLIAVDDFEKEEFSGLESRRHRAPPASIENPERTSVSA